MSKLVVLNLGKGDLKKGFPTVTVQLWEDGNRVPMQFTGALPAAPELLEFYRRWQLLYNLLYEALYHRLGWHRRMEIDEQIDEQIEIDEEDVTNVSTVEFSNLCDGLQQRINIWLKSKLFRNIEQKLRTKLAVDDEIRVIIQTESDSVRRLPWHLWDLFEDYHNAVVCLSTPEFERVKALSNNTNKIRILGILGNSEGIDVQKDRQMLEQLPGAQTVFLVEPQRQELDRWLWDKQGWDILFFAGHSSSQSDGETGLIYINKSDSLTIYQLKNALKAAIVRGLKLAIFNSCDGLGIAQQLASLHIPQMIVMREPVADIVAQEFLKHFLEAFAGGEPFYVAVREAQGRLQGLENEFPCASWLPVICQNPAEAALVWPKLSDSGDRPILPTRDIFSLIVKASVLITFLIIGVRELGILQSSELLAFDALMRLRPYEKPDQRILVVTITEADVQSQPANERRAASLSDRSLAQLVAKLNQFKPRVIGLDIYRENPVEAEYASLAKTMQTSDRFIATCKVGEENKNPGVPPPPEVPKQRLGFSDVVPDPDDVLRRQLLAMAPLGLCSTDKSLSFQLATRYLAAVGIQPNLTPEKNWQFGNVIFKNVKENTGSYRGIDHLGHQVLLNWRATPSVATQVTLADILNNKLTPDLVQNRVVLIGTSAESFHDYFSTPYSAGHGPHQPMSGVVVQAHMVSQILSAVLDNRPLLWVLPKWGEMLWIWCWSVIGGVVAWRFRLPLRLAIAGIMTVGFLNGVCLTLLIQGGWMPLVPSTLALLTTGGSVVTYTEFYNKKS